MIQIVTDAELAEFRAMADARMTSLAKLVRKGGETASVNGFKTQAWTVVTASLPCRIDGGQNAGTSTTRTVGGVLIETATRIGHLPWDWSDIQDGDVLVVTAGSATGHCFQVVDATWADQATARRVQLVEVARPKDLP